MVLVTAQSCKQVAAGERLHKAVAKHRGCFQGVAYAGGQSAVGALEYFFLGCWAWFYDLVQGSAVLAQGDFSTGAEAGSQMFFSGLFHVDEKFFAEGFYLLSLGGVQEDGLAGTAKELSGHHYVFGQSRQFLLFVCVPGDVGEA